MKIRLAAAVAVLPVVLATPGDALPHAMTADVGGSASWIAPAALQLVPAFDSRRVLVPVLPVPEDGAVPARGFVDGRQVAPRVLLAERTAPPAIGYSQEGIGSTIAGGFNPADVSLAVGHGYIAEAVNTAVGWWKTGAGFSLAPVRQLGDFFSTTATNRHADQMSDPRIVYDAPSSRWFFVAFDVTRAETDLAVSTTDDPTQGWWIYAFQSGGCPDQPRITVGDTMVAISYDLYSSCATRLQPYIGGIIRLFDKSTLLTGGAPNSSTYGPDARFIGITPVALLSGGSTIFFVSTDYLFSQVIVYTATSPSQSSIPLRRVPVGFLREAPPPAQAGTSVLVDAGDNRVQDAFLLGGNIWLAADDGCLHGGLFSACVRYEELTPGGQIIDEREEALAGGRSAMYPAFRPDAAGNLIAVFGFSSATDYPGLAVDIDPGRLSGYTELKDGTGSNTSGRWGDYFSASYDPVDNTRVWVAGAYGTPGGWGTYIAALATSPFSIPDPTPPPAPAPAPGGDSTSPRAVALPSQGRAGAMVRLRYRLADDSGRTRETVTVYRGTALLTTLHTVTAQIENGSVYSVTWGAPRASTANDFCVVATDPSGNMSRRSCASLRLTR